jgi:hypothetical protein
MLYVLLHCYIPVFVNIFVCVMSPEARQRRGLTLMLCMFLVLQLQAYTLGCSIKGRP